MQELDETNVFVKYLPPDVNDCSLRDLFSPFGEIVSVKVMVDPPTGASLGYGYEKRKKKGKEREERASG